MTLVCHLKTTTEALLQHPMCKLGRKVYQGSSERWKRYKPYLNGALDRLGVDESVIEMRHGVS
jgi:hypothetical protein